ncbi:MAG: gliding motility-associated protein GldM [Polaribacter sp.]|jgi:gliding motility-associated protein GldM
MAGGKMSARQKMINLMYLVFIAMLAMQMDKEVLSAFGFMNEKLEDNNSSTTEKNRKAYANLEIKANEQDAKFGKLNRQAIKIKKYSIDFYNYLGTIKTEMTADLEDKTAYESMDKTEFLNSYFFKGDGYTEEGQVFIDKINGYRKNINKTLGKDNYFSASLEERFNTNVEIDTDGKKVPWLKYRYEGFPLVASLTNLTQLQADIKNTESDIISNLLGGQLESDVSMSNYNGIVNLNKNAFYPGDKVTGNVFLGRYDPNLKPSRVILNGQKYNNFEDGSVVLDLRAGSVGEKDIKGTIYFMENEIEVPVPFKSSYSVISKPNSAVVAADKMNVVYRGIENPLTISIPGIATNLVKASAAGLRQVKGSSYVILPKEGKEKEITISVRGNLPDGTPIKTPKKFRVKDIPAAQGVIRGEFGKISLPGSSVANIALGAGLPDFLFDLKLVVTSFKVSVPGEFAVEVKGAIMSQAAKNLVSKARKGDLISIYAIKAKIIDNNYKLKRVLPIIIEVSN